MIERYIQRVGLIGLSGLFMAGSHSHVLAQSLSPQPMSPVEFIEMSRLNDPVLSPDGRYVAYLRSETDWQHNRSFDRLMLHDRQTGDNRPAFAPHSDTENMPAPDWLPDSRRFVVVLDRDFEDDVDERVSDDQPSDDQPSVDQFLEGQVSDEQAYLYNVDAQTLERLTAHPTDVDNVQVAPDGSGFYFMARTPRSADLQQALDDDFAVLPYEAELPEVVWFHDLTSRQSRVVIAGDFYTRGYDLSDDGTQILHMRASGPTSDDRHAADLWVHNLQEGTARRVTQNSYAENSYRLSPDNRSVAYIATVSETGASYHEDNLFIHRIGEPRPRLALADLPMEMLDFEWGAGSRTIHLLGNSGLRTQLYQYDVKTDSLSAKTAGDHVVRDWFFSPQSGSHAYVLMDENSPGEVHVMDPDGTQRSITQAYAHWPERYALPKQAAFSWRGRDGVPVEGLLVYPVGHNADRPFPLVTITHGGPRTSAQFGAWNSSRAVPVLAGQGYGVLLPNHRGGTGYGDAFMRDMVGGYFTNAAHDVMAGIDALIDAGLVDPEGLIKQGWSAGGHMTNWLITQTDRFAAASSGAGVADWVSMYGESDVRHNRTPWFGSAPWEADADLSLYRDHSPLFQASNITTPTVFYNGKNDVRVPPTQSILMYRAAQAAGAPTQLYLAPGQPHGFRRPGYRLFKVNTDLAWYATHLGRAVPEADLPSQQATSDEAAVEFGIVME